MTVTGARHVELAGRNWISVLAVRLESFAPAVPTEAGLEREHVHISLGAQLGSVQLIITVNQLRSTADLLLA